jgi:hypothetical protein
MAEDFGWALIVPLVILGPLVLYGALQFVLVHRWRGGWRLAALLPVGVFLLWLVWFGFDVARDPTARNLWPLELVIGAVGAAIFLVALTVARWVGGAHRTT